MSQNTFSIYQLKYGDKAYYMKHRNYYNMPYHFLEKFGLSVKASNYEFVYKAKLSDGTSLEDIFERFNLHHPADYKGRSLSVSDVVVLHKNGKDKAYYVDSYGFTDVPEFLA